MLYFHIIFHLTHWIVLVTYLRSNFCQNTNIRKIKASSNELNKIIMTCFFHLDNFKSQVFTFHSEGITVEFLRERERKKKKLNLLPLDRNIIYQKKKKAHRLLQYCTQFYFSSITNFTVFEIKFSKKFQDPKYI